MDASELLIGAFVTTAMESGMSDKALIHRKKADATIARVQIKSRHSMDVKEAALLLWINQFLPKYNKDIFNEEELQRLRNRVS